MPASERVRHFDEVLTGLAMYDAYVNRDTETLKSLVEQVPANEAVQCLLASLELMNGVFATQMRTTPQEIVNGVRRRVIREIAENSGKRGTR